MDSKISEDGFHNQQEVPQNTAQPRKIIGLIGIGVMTGEWVNKLIKSGHTVNIWNQNRQKCHFLRAEMLKEFHGRLRTYLSARAVLKSSDIVFNCVSDHTISKKIIRNNFGIYNDSDTILRNKGFVEMTSIHPEASRKIKEMIETKGGKYLEAQVQGGKPVNTKGETLILTAGDKLLFDECSSFFEAIGSHALYYGEVGYAVTINLILQQMRGVCLAALAEGLALAVRCGIEQDDFLEILRSTTGISSSYLMGNADFILRKNYTIVQQSLKNMQHDLNLGLDMSKGVAQPMFLAATASEILKHCQSSGYGDHDVSVIYQYQP